MNNTAAILMIVLFSSSLRANTELSVAAGAFVETNVYHRDQGDRADTFFRIKPEIKHDSESSLMGFNSQAGGSYNKYLQFSNQDYFDYNASAKLSLAPYGKFGGYINGGIRKISEPAVSDSLIKNYTKKTQIRVDRLLFDGGGGLFWRATSLSLIRLSGSYVGEVYADSEHQYLNNADISGSAYYDYQFLPETVFYIGGEGGVKSYPSGLKNRNTSDKPSYIKYDSNFISGRAGIRGRLAERTRVDASGAWLIRNYTKYTSFNEPIFNLRVEEQFGPKDLLIAGYDYEVHDTKWSNYVVDQSTYIGYARILGDQILLLSKMAYTYSSFSKPYKREDQRLAGSFKMDYSLTPKSKISVLFDLDILNSDQFKTVFLDGEATYDPAVSYENFKGGIEYTQYF